MSIAKKPNDPVRKLDIYLKKLLGLTKTAKSGGNPAKVRVIIQYNERLQPKHVSHLIRCIGSGGAKRHRKLGVIRSIAVTVPLSSLPRLCKHPSVHQIHADQKKRTRLNVASPAIGASFVHKRGFTGKGVTIAVLDTGINPHRDLVRPNNRIVAFRDFVNGKTGAYDDNGHGTHCAGCAAGNGTASGGVYAGSAPGAKLAGVKVLNRQGEGFDSTIIQGVQWCIRNRGKYGIRILSLSLGGTAVKPWSQDPLCQALNEAWKKGLVVLAAAGNSGPSGGTIDTPGITPAIVTVGASNDRNTVKLSDDTVASFSSRGPALGGGSKPDLIAPGTNIVSLRSPGSRLDITMPNSRVGSSYFTLSGTSMATPLTAGAAALWLQKNPKLSPNGVKARLKRGTFNLRKNPYHQGNGIVNVRPIVKN